MGETSVVLGVDDRALQEEVLHFLERSPSLRVVGAVDDGAVFERSVAEARPDAAVATPSVLAGTNDLDGATLFVVAERETSAALRSAIRAGARGFYLWPEEREALLADATRSRRSIADDSGRRGRVVAVYGVRGGAGATFLATNLAGMLARLGTDVVLVDADPFFADVTAALGIGPQESVRTTADLSAVADELTVDHLDRVLYLHPRGFRVLLAPQDPLRWEAVPPELPARAAEVLRESADVVIVHLPRALDAALPSLDEADDVLLAVSLDVLAFRDAQRVLAVLTDRGLDPRCRLIVNRATRAEIVPEDAERVFGLSPAAVFQADRAVARAQNRGELLVDRGGQTTRRLRALARSIVQEVRA